jgi:hypothetical protein
MGAWNARLRAVGCRDSIHRGWATAVLLDRVTFVASLTDLSRQDLSALLDLAPAVLEQALVVTVDLGHPDDDLDTTDPGPVPEPPEYTVEDPGTWPHDADELKG